MMNIKIKGKVLILLATVLTTLGSCVMDRKTAVLIKNCTKDTLLIELTDSDMFDNWIYWDLHPENADSPIMPEDTTWISVHGERVIIDNFFYALPDSTLPLNGDEIFCNHDTCYIYAIKWQVARSYTPDEIRAKKLYDKRAVTKKDFHHRLFEYRRTTDPTAIH